MAEYYDRDSNHWLVGAEIFKNGTALRCMCNPTLDGRSIDNQANYTSTLDVHYSSGIYNKAYCTCTPRPRRRRWMAYHSPAGPRWRCHTGNTPRQRTDVGATAGRQAACCSASTPPPDRLHYTGS
ncbi:M4 family metallopeptidase [Dyella sp. KRB-257]|uniref:M4 family metallopeptidase n=1 Tax=Dyella sp. KRB-257 TaxID=3400915 RepID=UPI003C04B075